MSSWDVQRIGWSTGGRLGSQLITASENLWSEVLQSSTQNGERLQFAIENGPVEMSWIFPAIKWWIFPWQNVNVHQAR